MNVVGFKQGVVSLFTVLFTTLLLTVITVSFLRIMLQEQRQSQNQDLSQSAYDSAISGVEDAKRVLRACYQQGAASQACKAIADQTCDTISSAGVVAGVSGQETVVRGESGDTSMNQAYTCVKVIRDTLDYLGDIDTAGKSAIVPLRAKGTFNKVVIEWMHRSSAGGKYSGGDSDVLLSPLASDINHKSLPSESNWNKAAPALMRVTAVLPPDTSSVSTAQLDSDIASTVFLRPWVPATSPNPFGVNVSTDNLARTANGGAGSPAAYIQEVDCSKDMYSDMAYACKATLTMPTGASAPALSQVAFMRLTALYNATSFRITLYNDTDPVEFDGVQPEVDSTGRASDLFRRVISKVSGEFEPPYYVDAALSTTFNLCKDFYITDEAVDANGRTCGD